ncbi:MAG TPA: DUF952 domain-containing protein [Spirochaetia bacterium]|nr:DUF952 domain-containing protein [Spirochaetia bacterium]
MRLILHITDRDAWDQAATGRYYTPPSFGNDGFIHCSTVEQTAQTANLFFRGREGLVLLCIDKERLEATVKYEPPVAGNVEDRRESQLFPHIYGPLNVSSVTLVVDLVPKNDGTFELPVEVENLVDGAR